jgi:hypothetical protein
MTQYGANGFVPTVERVKREGGRLVFQTTDASVETDIVSTDDGLKRKADFMSPQQRRTRELEEMF